MSNHPGDLYNPMMREKKAKIREREEDAAAFDAMIAKHRASAHAFTPPPFRFDGVVRTAGALAAARDRRLGILDES